MDAHTLVTGLSINFFRFLID